MNRIVFTGGGTGGHIFPGLAVIAELRAAGFNDIVWIGSSSGMDRAIVEREQVRFIGIPTGKLRRYFSFHNFLDIFRIFAGILVSFFQLLILRPVLVFSKGGFVSVPPCLAAFFLRIPVITHECDFSPGLATRINSRFASEIYVTYPETRSFFSKAQSEKVIVTGNPVRPVFYHADAKRGLEFLGLTETDLPVLLVLGGSLGSQQVNEFILGCLPDLTARFTVVHQTGETDALPLSPTPDAAQSKRYLPYAFFRSEMPDVLSVASVIVARAGAGTVWECATLGKPMVLIPLEKGSSRGDQVENARFFEKNGAAVMLTGVDVTRDRLLSALERCTAGEAMAKASGALAAGNPALLIAGLLRKRLSAAGEIRKSL